MKTGEIRWNARRKVELTSIVPTPCGHSPKSGSIDITLNRASTPGSNRNEFVRSPVRYAVKTTMYVEVTTTIGIASQRSRVSALSHAIVTTNPTLIQVVRRRNARSLARITSGTETGTVAR